MDAETSKRNGNGGGDEDEGGDKDEAKARAKTRDFGPMSLGCSVPNKSLLSKQ